MMRHFLLGNFDLRGSDEVDYIGFLAHRWILKNFSAVEECVRESHMDSDQRENFLS